MQLHNELLNLRVEFEQFQASQDNQQKMMELRFNTFSEKLEKLSLSANYENSLSSAKVKKQSRESVLQAMTNGRGVFPADKNKTALICTETFCAEKIRADNTLRSAANIQEDKEIASQAPRTNQPQKFVLDSDNAVAMPSVLGDFSAVLLGPFAALTEQIKSFYKHYQQQGLGPVFLMTIVGIITLTVGFSYLLQYSINNWFSELAKALTGFAAANAIILLAIFIRKKRPDMQDFSSGLVGLGLILNYLCAYFIGPYFEILPNSLSFPLLLLITLAGFVLSSKLETRVVAVVALAGGSLAPIMLLSGSHTPLLYLPYLLIIGSSALVHSRMLKWPALFELTALMHVACIESFLLYIGQPFAKLDWQVVIALISVNSIFYIYAFSALFVFNKAADEDPKEIVLYSKGVQVLPFALLAFALLTISQLTLFSGEIFLANSLLCLAAYLFFKRHKQQRPFMIIFAASFAGFAALQLVSQDFLGLVLLLEGLLLLWLGAKEFYLSVRLEAYLLLAIGLLSNVAGLAETVSVNGYAVTQSPFILTILLLTSVALYGSSSVLTKLLSTADKSRLIPLEGKICKVIKELLSLSYTACILLCAYLVSDRYFLNITPLITLLLLYLATKGKLKFTEILAWLLLLPLLGLIIMGMLDAGSANFTQQPLYAQLARVELFVSLLLAYYWYQRYFSDSKIIKFAYLLQLLCLLALPLLFLPKVLRQFADYISIALWLSCLTSLLLARYVRYRALILEAQIISISAIIVTAFSCLNELWQGLAALAVGSLLMTFLLYRYLSLDKISKLIVRLQWQLSPYYFALVIAVLTHSLMRFWQANWAVTTTVLCAYFALLIRRTPVAQVLHRNYSTACLLTLLFAAVPLLMHSQQRFSLSAQSLIFMLCEAAILLILGTLILDRGAAVRLHRKMLPLGVLQWGWHSLLGLSYLLWSYQFTAIVAAPLSAILLVVHGSCLMFISLREGQEKTIKLAGILFALATIKVLLVDMASFEIIQKVIAFMVIGIILLSVSYFYQKQRNQQLASNPND